jgi:uncharacterized membrane protein
MDSIRSQVSRGLYPLKGGLWLLFLLWTAGMAVVWTGNIGDAQLERAIGNTDLRLTLEWLIRVGDIVWITLGAINVHGSIAGTEGIRTARRWAPMVCGGGLAVAAASALTGFPLGSIRYGTALGMKLGPVPCGVPLLWFVLVIGARSTLLRAFPRAINASNARVGVTTGALVLLADFNLEPAAAKLRGFWFWVANPPSLPPVFDPPMMNYAAWFVFGTLFAYMLREERVVADPRSRSWKPVIVFGLFNAVFLLADLGRVLRR